MGISLLFLGGGAYKKRIQLSHSYDDIVSLENLCAAWQEFIVGKRQKHDVQHFSRNLMDHIVALHQDLANRTWHHGGYESFFVNDPKRRHIHKASVRDRLVHRATYRILYPFFERIFIADSFSCRDEKGTHKALAQFKAMTYQVSKNHTRTCWVLKCDIKKFFDSIDHAMLLKILYEYIPDPSTQELLKNVVESYSKEGTAGVGLPLGNLTSQLFANVYLNIYDQWMKHHVKATHYIRYADDFVILSENREWLAALVPKIKTFLQQRLKLILHPHKLSIATFASGVDFLGWVHFPDHKVVRPTTARRMLRRVQDHPTQETVSSYLGLLQHGNTYKLRGQVKSIAWLWHER